MSGNNLGRKLGIITITITVFQFGSVWFYTKKRHEFQDKLTSYEERLKYVNHERKQDKLKTKRIMKLNRRLKLKLAKCENELVCEMRQRGMFEKRCKSLEDVANQPQTTCKQCAYFPSGANMLSVQAV